MDFIGSDVSIDEGVIQESITLLNENLNEQLSNETYENFDSPVDILSPLLEKIHFALTNFTLEEESIESLKRIKEEAIMKVGRYIAEFFNPDTDFLEGQLRSNYGQLYEFFVINRFKNIQGFLTEFILQNRESLATRYKSVTSKNFDFTALKGDLKLSDPQLYFVIANFEAIVKETLEAEGGFTISTMASYLAAGDAVWADFIDQLFPDDFAIKAQEESFEHFVNPLIASDKYDDFISDLKIEFKLMLKQNFSQN